VEQRSQTSPMPSRSASRWSTFRTRGQLSQGSRHPSESGSGDPPAR
jgi:hypothetical protein